MSFCSNPVFTAFDEKANDCPNDDNASSFVKSFDSVLSGVNERASKESNCEGLDVGPLCEGSVLKDDEVLVYELNEEFVVMPKDDENPKEPDVPDIENELLLAEGSPE